MKEILSEGFTHVLHTYSEEDLRYYRETMKEIIDMTVDLGLKVLVNPWGIGRVFGGEAYSELVSENPKLAQVGLDGKTRPAVCPNRREFVDFLCHWLDAVAETRAETVFWDEPHFYFTKGHLENWACLCPHCQKLFFEQFGFEMPKSLTREVVTFRENSLIQFLDKVTREARARNLKNAVCLLPPWFPAGLDDWGKVASLEAIDEVACDPYQERGDSKELVRKHYGDSAKKLAQVARKFKKKPQLWIKNYSIESGREDDVILAIEEALQEKIDNLFAWSFLGSEYLSMLRSDDPQKTWRTLCDAFKHFSA